MSSLCLLFIGLLLFAATNGNNIQQKDILHRNHRSLANLNSMWTELTGTDGPSKFINYGNWCGLGGSGTPVDPLDGCCQSHDLCYNEIESTVCKNRGMKALYGTNYHYKVESDKATCDGYLKKKKGRDRKKRLKSRNTGELGNSSTDNNDDQCGMALCLCDVVLNNCVKYNFHLYNAEHHHPISVFDAIMQGNFIKNLK